MVSANTTTLEAPAVGISNQPTQADVDAVEKALATMPQVSLPVKHHFTPGLYIREIFMPKGAHVVTAVHKTDHIFVISAGAVSVWDEQNGFQQLQAPHTGLTTPGTRRVIHVKEDCVWLTMHPNPTNETDLAALEDMLIHPRPVNLKRDEGSRLGIRVTLPKEVTP